MSQATEQVLNLERAMWEQANDKSVFETAFADDMISVIEPMGVVTKEQALSMMSDAAWTDLEISDVTFREPTDDCVIVAYHGSAVRGGKKERDLVSVCSTYLKRDGRWQLVASAHQPWKPSKEVDATG